jgi:uncharacterized protein (DUF2267 family)
MDELAKQIAAQAGIPEAQAQKAAQVAVKFLKDKLPAPLAGQIDAALSNTQTTQAAASLLGKGMGLLGKKE